MFFPPMRLPVPKCDEADPGIQVTAGAVAASTTLAKGYYLIASESVALKWKLGATDVTVATGSFLAGGDQVIIFVPTDATKLSFIRVAAETADGFMAINSAVFKELSTEDFRTG